MLLNIFIKVIDQNGRVSHQDRPAIDDKSTVLKKTLEGLSSEQLTAIAIGESINVSTDKQGNTTSVSDENNETLTHPKDPERD